MLDIFHMIIRNLVAIGLITLIICDFSCYLSVIGLVTLDIYDISRVLALDDNENRLFLR